MRAEFDDEEDVNDGFHDENGEERIIDTVTLDEAQEGFFLQEERKLNEKSDSFAKIDFGSLDRNAKRRIKRDLQKRFRGSTGVETKHINPEEINGYDFYGLATPPYNLDYLVELAVENATHAACIQAKVVNIVGLGFQWEETNKVKAVRTSAADDDERMTFLARKLDRVTATLDDWIEELNEEDDLVDILMRVWADVEATGNGYLEVGRNRDGSIGYLGHVPAATVRVRLARDGFMQLVERPDRMIFFRNFGDQDTTDPLGRDRFPNELIHVKKHTPMSAYYGVPDIIAALPAVAGDKFAAAYNLDYFENKAVPRYALIIKGAKLSTQAERRILEYFRREVKGKHHGTLYIPVPAPMGSNVDVELQPIENKVQDASFAKYRADNRLEIMMVHRTPASKIGIEGGGQGATASRESDKTFKTQVCKPEQRRMEKKLNRIVAEKTDMFRFKFVEYDLIDEETQSRIDDRYIRLGVLSPNEVRAKRGLAPRKGGDSYVDPAAESAAKIELQQQQAKAATMKQVSEGTTGGSKGPAKRTTDGARSTGTGTTPKDQSAQGRESKGARIDAKGSTTRER